MIVGVRNLKDLWKEKSPCFGNKANALSNAMHWGETVPPGFCITFDLKREYNEQLCEFLPQISKSYQWLMEERGNCRVIVRSSADLEDGEKALFPGIFRSIPGVMTLSELLQAIQDCIDSTKGAAVGYYAWVNAAECEFRYFTVLVQEELCSEYAGVAATQIPVPGYAEKDLMMAILAQGDNHALVRGFGPCSTYSFGLTHDKLFMHRISGDVCMTAKSQNRLFGDLYRILNSLRKKTGRELEIEWGYTEEKVHIFQIRFEINLAPTGAPLEKKEIANFSSDREQGLKYQAMRFFQEQGLFPRKTLFIPRESSAERSAELLVSWDVSGPITVRFSKEGAIGLPRFFAPSKEAASQYVQAAKQPDWSIIAYPSLTVQKSYELYIDWDVFILEYVPGIWESDSSLAADTVILTQDRSCIWLVKQPRNAKYEDEKGAYTLQVLPTSLDQIKGELSARVPTFRRLKEMFSRDLPLNFHFISDGEQDHYLNCRRTNRILWEERYGGPVQIVETMADCSRWDGRSGILFRPKLHRGEEFLLFQFAPFLKSLSVPIFVEFGILSHPAIMLRELGISVIPYFLHHDYFEIPLEGI